jgi:hypothetical protein
MKSLYDHKLMLLALVAIASALVVGTVVIDAGAAQPAPATASPAWVQSQASAVVDEFAGSQTAAQAVTSVSFVKTTWGQYEKAIGGNGDPNNGREVYVVVAHGNFTSTTSAPTAAARATPKAITGTVLVVAIDVLTQSVGNIDMLYSERGLASSALGTASPISLTEYSSPSMQPLRPRRQQRRGRSFSSSDAGPCRRLDVWLQDAHAPHPGLERRTRS